VALVLGIVLVSLCEYMTFTLVSDGAFGNTTWLS